MKNKGFTLVEVLVAMLIATIIMFAVANFGQNILSLNQSASQSLTAGLESRQAMKVMIRELRALESLDAVATSSISFSVDLNQDENLENIRYFLDLSTQTLKREVDGVQNILVANIISTSTPIFDYYDQNYAGTSTSLALPVDLSTISLVKVTLMVDKDPNRLPKTLITTSQVSLRNLKSNL